MEYDIHKKRQDFGQKMSKAQLSCLDFEWHSKSRQIVWIMDGCTIHMTIQNTDTKKCRFQASGICICVTNIFKSWFVVTLKANCAKSI